MFASLCFRLPDRCCTASHHARHQNEHVCQIISLSALIIPLYRYLHDHKESMSTTAVAQMLSNTLYQRRYVVLYGIWLSAHEFVMLGFSLIIPSMYLPALMLKARAQFFLMMLSVTASSPSPSSCKYNHSPTHNHPKLLFGHLSCCFQGHMSAHLSVVQARDRN